MKQSVLNLDARYTVTIEYCGAATSKYVARFCGKFLSNHDTVLEANNACHALAKHRQAVIDKAWQNAQTARDDAFHQARLDSGMYAHIYN